MTLNGLVPNRKMSAISEVPVVADGSYPLMAGDPRILEFLNTLSKKILTDPQLKQDPSYVALGFWLRKASIGKILKENKLEELKQLYNPAPVGLVFHLCPSNVDTMFFYSLTLALLGGNKNLIRVSSRLEEASVFRLFELINQLIKTDEFSIFGSYISILSYERNDDINEAFSKLADGRVIWGGDQTIEQFKKYQTKYRVKDLYFTDRTSFSLIKVSEQWNSEESYADLTKKLYTDIYTFDQMGCSSPHCIFLIGEKKQTSSFANRLYERISGMAQEAYDRDISSMASFKLNKSVDDILEGTASSIRHDNNFFVMSNLLETEVPHSCGMGYTYYKELTNTDELIPYVNEKVQTLGVAGFDKEELQQLLPKFPPNAVDRIVPIGKALEFDYIWDGYNIFLELLNFKSIK